MLCPGGVVKGREKEEKGGLEAKERRKKEEEEEEEEEEDMEENGKGARGSKEKGALETLLATVQKLLQDNDTLRARLDKQPLPAAPAASVLLDSLLASSSPITSSTMPPRPLC